MRLCHLPGSQSVLPSSPLSKKNTTPSWYLSPPVVLTACPHRYLSTSFTHVPELVNTYNQTASQLVILIKKIQSCKLHTKSKLKFPKLQASHVPNQHYEKSLHYFQLLVSHQNQKVWMRFSLKIWKTEINLSDTEKRKLIAEVSKTVGI